MNPYHCHYPWLPNRSDLRHPTGVLRRLCTALPTRLPSRRCSQSERQSRRARRHTRRRTYVINGRVGLEWIDLNGGRSLERAVVRRTVEVLLRKVNVTRFDRVGIGCRGRGCLTTIRITTRANVERRVWRVSYLFKRECRSTSQSILRIDRILSRTSETNCIS